MHKHYRTTLSAWKINEEYKNLYLKSKVKGMKKNIDS